MILYTENPKDSTQKLINEFSKVAGYKINIHVSVAFLYSNNEIKESKKKITFNIMSKKNAPQNNKTKLRNKPDKGG